MRENYKPTRSTSLQKPIRTPTTPILGSQTLLLSSNPTPNQFKKFLLPKENIMQAVSIVQWRCQTSLPIVRVAQYIVNPQGHRGCQKQMFRSQTPNKKNDKNESIKDKTSLKIKEFVSKNGGVVKYELKVQAEDIKCRLNQVGIMPFSQALYLLREMLIGFQALFDIFSNFEAKEELIGVNSSDQWCMWIDEDYCNNVKAQSKITERQFIYKLITITQKHSLQTIQSRNFFSAAKESTYANDCSFIKMLEKLKHFINANRIYIPSKVTFRIENKNGAQNEQQHLNNPAFKQEIFKKRKQSCQTFYAYNQPVRQLPNIKMRSYPSCSELRKGALQNNICSVGPSSPIVAYQKNISFEGICDNWQSKKLNSQDSSVSLKLLREAQQKQIHNNRFCKTQYELPTSALSRVTSYPNSSTPVFYLSRPKNFKRPQAPITKPVSQLHEPVKRANIRKYSQQLIKFKSVETFANKRFQSSSICNKLVEQKGMQQKWEEQQKVEIEVLKSKQVATPSQNSQGFIPSSPNNSSSTKEIANSGEMEQDSPKPAYRNMKMKDLAPHRKNNQSLINNNFSDKNNKNMTVSYQFKNIEVQSDSQSQEDKKAPQQQRQWVNKISDLFSDTMSIKQLKGSIKFKTKQQQLFEKDYLKDVKLDMLQKFGRSVTINCQQDNDTHHPRITKHNQYKSMQLIEEQLEEVKSYQEDERREDEFTSKSIKSIRSRRQTQGQIDKEREISFQDQFIIYEQKQKGQGVFNFETEMYSIRAHRAI